MVSNTVAISDSVNNEIVMANAIRILAIDAVQAANSGHPGAPMGMADMAVALWKKHLKHNPNNPNWLNRDRFVLSNGHASMLIYALLHLTGYHLSIDDLQKFRQLHSKTPGHPEVDITPGVETTTGPLGQGITNAVGMALAEKLLAAEFNRPLFNIVDHHTYVFMGDGCLMEGISHEAIALAGAWKLNKLIALYDDNGISIDGQVAPWFIDDTPKRFESCGWHVISNVNGHDSHAVSHAILMAKQVKDKPVLICCKTHIGKGSPNRANTNKAHGEPLGTLEIELTRQALGWTALPFDIPKSVKLMWDCSDSGQQVESDWNKLWADYSIHYPQLAEELYRRMQGQLPQHFARTIDSAMQAAINKAETIASRKSSQIVLEALTAALPELLGGSADLTSSNLTNTSNTPPFRVDHTGNIIVNTAGQLGRHINYGVREFGMAAIMNGIALHGGFIPYGGTFLTFSDYSRNAIRMVALMKRRVVYVFTHDSIGLGEDGPTHQSIEHIASLRLIPNLDVWRPCDTAETVVAWASAIENKHRPSALLFSRQNLAYIPKNNTDHLAKGGYILREPIGVNSNLIIQAIIIATGSEVSLAVEAQSLLAVDNIAVRVVSMPSTTVFDRQSTEYKLSVLPVDIPSIAVEMGVMDGWWKYGCKAVVGINSYGESAPAPILFKHFGFTADTIVNTVRQVLIK